MMWPYSQADHDYATEVGGVGMVVTVVLIVVVAAILVLAVVA